MLFMLFYVIYVIFMYLCYFYVFMLFFLIGWEMDGCSIIFETMIGYVQVKLNAGFCGCGGNICFFF